MLIVYTAAIFLSATLLFLVQPMVGKMVLPSLGGTPAVWNTCMVFFQVLLLIGYAYADAVTRWLGGRAQAVVHVVVALAPAVALPIALPRGLNVPSGEFPIPWLLGVLVMMAGVPFLVLSTNGPLLQRWFAATDSPRASNPYFLYAASNGGSLLALLGYPIVIEPWLTLRQQSVAWAAGYAVLAVLLAACAVYRVVRARPEGPGVGAAAGAGAGAVPEAAPVTWRTRGLWILLSFAPSSLMIGATTFISTDVAPVPLLWVIPLSIYLLTMILAFSRVVGGATRLATVVLPIALLALIVSLLMEARRPISVLVALHLVTLAAGAMACHGRLSMMRPDPRRLTEFYLLMSVGGALGGLFNGIVAPLVFDRILEYPIALTVSVGLALVLSRGDAMSGLIGAVRAWTRKSRTALEGTATPAPTGRRPAPAWIVPIGFGALLFVASIFVTLQERDPNWKILVIKLYVPAGAAIVMMIAGWKSDEGSRWRRWTLNAVVPVAIAALYVCLEFSLEPLLIADTRKGNALAFGLPVLAAYLLVRWPWRFTLTAAMLLCLSAFSPGLSGFPLLTERSFFGVHRIVIRPDGGAFELLHGNTQHGSQLRIPGKEHIPTTYYHRTGPIGDVFRLMNDEGRIRSVGLVGLGTGTLAAYALPGQTFTFYEIDPSIIRAARDAKQPNGQPIFTYLRDAQGTIEFKVGDGRLLLERAEGVKHDLIILDAFSSDAVPTHLLTVEAIRIYLERLSEHGVIVFHTSNRHLWLVRVLTGNAEALGLAIKLRHDSPTREQAEEGKNNSEWIAVARTWDDLEFLENGSVWWRMDAVPGLSTVWTDDFSNILGIMQKEVGD